jgi:hypothetical protein
LQKGAFRRLFIFPQRVCVKKILTAKSEKTPAIVIESAQNFPVALQPGGKNIGGDNDADADRQRHDDGPDAEEDQLAGDVRIGCADKLRQEGHEKDDDLGVQQIDPDAVQQGRFQGGLCFFTGAFHHHEIRALADCLYGEPDQIGRTTGFQDHEGGRRGDDESRDTKSDQQRMHGDADIGSDQRHEARRPAFAQRAADPERHVRPRRHRQKQNGNGEGDQCWQARNEIHRGTRKIWRMRLLNAVSCFCQCF